jgi:hypothetical protein
MTTQARTLKGFYNAVLYNPFRVKRRSADVTQGGTHDYVVR